MRKLFGLVAALGLVMSAAQPAHAVVQSLSSASLTIYLGTLPPLSVTWNGTGSADVTSSTILGLSSGIFNFTGTTPVDPSAFPVAGLAYVGLSNGVGNFAGVDTAAGGGLMAVSGVANVCLFASCAAPPANVSVPFTTGGVNGMGLGGAPIVSLGAVNVTVNGNGWTTGTVAVGPISMSGSPLAGGHVTLITPTIAMTNMQAFAVLPIFSVLDLTFVPEPGTLVLLASGVAGLAMVGRKRMSK